MKKKYPKKRYTKKRYTKKRNTKKRYTKKRYTKKRYTKKRYTKKRIFGGSNNFFEDDTPSSEDSGSDVTTESAIAAENQKQRGAAELQLNRLLAFSKAIGVDHPPNFYEKEKPPKCLPWACGTSSSALDAPPRGSRLEVGSRMPMAYATDANLEKIGEMAGLLNNETIRVAVNECKTRAERLLELDSDSEISVDHDELEANAWTDYRYGHISGWDTKYVTDMSNLFHNVENFNQDIGGWNTENVTDMSRMFAGAQSFNKDIGRWNTGKVENMSRMFYNAVSFDQDIGRWNTDNVTDMGYMFTEAQSFNQDLGCWNTGKVTNMREMFRNAQKTTIFRYVPI